MDYKQAAHILGIQVEYILGNITSSMFYIAIICDPIWQNPPLDTLAEAPFAFKIVVILRLQSRETDPWHKCPTMGFVRSDHILVVREYLTDERNDQTDNTGILGQFL